MAWNRNAEKPVTKAPTGSKGFWIWGMLLAVSVIGGVFVFIPTPETEVTKEPKEQGQTGSRKLRRNWVKPTGTASDVVRKAMPKVLPSRKHDQDEKPVEIFSHLTGSDRRFAEAVQAALDSDDLKATVEAVQKAMASTNTEVRINAVEALGWFGSEALPELTACMMDADEEVQQTAANQWELAIEDVAAPDERFKVVAAAFSILGNEDQLTSFGGLMDSAATEWIDSAEEKTVEDERRLEVVQTLVDIIEGGGSKNAEAARDVYESVTGNEWKGIDEAEKYLGDPDNYEPPEDNASATTD